MSTELILTNATVVGPDAVFSGSVRLRGAHIADVDPGASATNGAARLDLEGDYLLPGLIELHTDYLETQLQPRPGVVWPSALAAVLAHDTQLVGAGITTVLDSICCGDLHKGRNRSALLALSLEAIRAGTRSGVLRAEHLLHLRCEVCDPDVLGMFEPLADEPDLKLVSLMDHTPGQRQFTSTEKFRQYYKSKAKDWSDESFAALHQALLDQQAANSEPNRRRIVDLCAERGVPLASHDDTTVGHILEGMADGVAVSEFPTTLTAARAARGAGIAVVMGAPNVVRKGSHSGNVSAMDLAAEGLLDCLSSDYVPASLLHAAFALHQQAGMDLAPALATVTATPAATVGLDDRGVVAPGRRADLVRVKLIDGHPVVRQVWRAGQQVF